MAIKQPALIAARDNRKKKKEKEILKAPTAKTTVSKPKTITVKSNDKGKTYVDRSTISKKPTVQNTTQNRIVTNKDRLTSKSNFGGINNDIRTVKTTKKSKPKQNYSVGTYDIYKRDGRYYYNDGKEKEVDKNFVEKAIKEKKTGVIGNYDSKGQLRTTDSRGNVKAPEKNLLKNIARVGKGVKLGGEKGAISIASKELQDLRSDLDKGEKIKKPMDYLSQISNIIYNSDPRRGMGTAIKNAANNAKELWKDNEKKTLEKVVGTFSEAAHAGLNGDKQGIKDAATLWGAVLPKDTDKKVEKLERKINEPINKKLEKFEEEKENYSNIVNRSADIGRTVGNMLPGIGASVITRNPDLGILATMASVRGQSTERAEKAGKNLDEAIKYGDLMAAIEGGTEYLSGGLKVFGKGPKGNWLKGGSESIDDVVMNAINAKVTNPALNFALKSGAGITGEQFEEVLSDILGTVVDIGTIDPNATYTLEDLKRTLLDTGLSTIAINALTGGYGSGAYNSNINDMNNFNIQQQQANEINQLVESGEIDDIEGLALLDQVKDGTYQKNRNLEQIATQESQRLKQAAQQGIISQEQYTQDLQTLTNAVNQTREEINTNGETELSKQLERQGTKVLEEAESLRNGMIDNFKEYLEENNITNPTQEDINNSMIDALGYDYEGDYGSELKNEKLYNQYAREYMKENNIPFKENNQQESIQDSTINNETKVKQVENKSDLKEVVDEDLYNVDIKDVENQIYRENYKLNEDVEDEDGPVGNYWDIDDTYFNLKDGNTLWIETPTEYGKLKNGKTNYNDEIHNKIKIFIEDANGNIIEEKTLNNEKGEFTREDIINEIKSLTYDDSNKQAEGQIDMFGNVHVGKISNKVETNQVENKSNDNREFLEGYPDDVINHWSNNDKEIVVKNYKQLDSLIDEALNNGEINNRLHLGRINESIVDKIRNMISNFPKKKQNYFSSNVYDIVLNQSEIRHLKEDKIKVTNEDIHDYIKKIPDIISKPDNVIYSDDGNNEGLRFEKKYSDGRYYSFTLVNDKKRTLQVKTSFMDKSDFEAKKRSMSLQSDATKAPNRTSETSKAFASYEDNIQQNNQNVNTGPEILDKMPVEKNTTIKSLKKGLDKFRQEITDRFAPVYDMARKMKNPTLYHEADAILKSDAMAQVDLGMNQVNLKGKPYKNFTDENGNKVSMSYERAYDLYKEIPVKAKNEYLVHWLNVDRLNQGVDQFGIPLQESLQKIQELENEYENMGKWSENIYQFYRNLTQNMVDNGRVSQELADKWLKETPHFVHIERQVPNKGNQGVSVRNGKVDSDNLIRKVKGGNYPILPIKESTARYVQNSRRAFAYNQFGKEYVRTIGYDSQGNNVSESADIDEIFGFDPEFVNSDGKGNYTMKIYEKGVPVEIPISEDVYNSLSPKNIPRVGVLAEATNLYKDLLTNKNPFFGFLRNPIRDAGDMFLYSKHPLRKSLATYGKLFAGRTALRNRVITKDGVTAQDIVDFYNNTGNGAHSFYKNGQFESQKGGIRKNIDKALSPIEKGNDFMESMPRITEFWNTIESEGYTIKDGELVPQKGKNPKKTADQVLAEASFYAADVTVNFKRGGRTSKAISQNGGIFFNPSVQGASKFTRNITEAVGDAKAGDYQAAKRLVARAAMMGVAPAILSAAMYGGDDDYEEMQDYQKDQYYLIRRGNGKWVRIPKGRAISLFESAARRTIDKSKGNKDSFKGYGQLVMNQIAPNNPLDNNIASPIFAAINNKSWSGNKIVSDSMAKRPVEEQFNEKTDELSKKLGKQLHISPMKINYVLDQYSGVLGDLILPQITPRSSNGTSNPIVSILKDNYTFDAANSNKSVGNFYDVKGKLNTKANSVNPTSEDKLKSQYMNKQSQKMYALYTKKQKIQMDNSLSKKEKYEQSLEVQKEINKFAKKATENVKDIDIKENTATIGGDLYYKNKNSKSGWSQESEKTTKTRKELGLSPEKYYYYKNDESYKTPDGYTRSITSGKNAKQTIAIVDAFNFDPSDYLKYKYKLSQIHGDKDSRGRTIRYSARNKKIKYLNSLPISAVEKAYLLKQNDKYYRSSDSSLKKAISNSNLSNKEKQEIYSYLKLGR